MELSKAITALITPFKGVDIDFDGLKRNIEFQIENGISALLVLGSTGEALSLTIVEKEALIRCAIETIQKRVPCMVNASAQSVKEACDLAKTAERMGADCLLLAPPAYICPTEEGIIKHFESVLGETTLPIMLYNIPKRVGVSITPKVAKHFADHTQILGVKEASGDLPTALSLGAYLTLYAGNDAEYLPLHALGAQGVVSVLSNFDPKLIAMHADKPQEHSQKEIVKLSKLLQCGPNPAPIKALMNAFDMPAGPCRLPLTPIPHENELEMANLARETLV